MKIFLSYCHADKPFREDFSRWITILKDKKIIVEWHDGMLTVGDDVDYEIDRNMDDSDIVAFFVSSHFLNSDTCKKEIDRAMRLKNERDISIMPIILEPCPWADSLLRAYLACPENGKPITNWPNRNSAWDDVYNKLKTLINSIALKKKELTPEFKRFLENPGDFISSNNNEIIKMENIFVPPMLTDETPRKEKKTDNDISSERLLKRKNDIVLVLGEEQSGKTALCQMLYSAYHEEDDLYPIYIDGKNVANDNFDQIEKTSIEKQYKKPDLYRNISANKKIILLDGLLENDKLKPHSVLPLINKIKEKKFNTVILLTDNPFFYNPKWQEYEIKSNIQRYRLKIPGHMMRSDIIKKWMCTTQKTESVENFEKLTDFYRERINAMFVENNVPPYPFYVLSFLEIISNASHTDTSAPQNITSYGHCYHALIIKFLAKVVMTRLDVEIYVILLTELAYFFHKSNKTEITESDFLSFYNRHRKKFNVDIDYETMKSKLIASGLLQPDLFNKFRLQEYVFCYFCAKHLAEKMTDEETKEEAQEEIALIFKNVHRKRSGNILLFLIHHAPKSSYLSKSLNNELNSLFRGIPEAKLTVDETAFFGKYIANLQFPSINIDASDEDREENRGEMIKGEESQEKADTQLNEDAEEKNEQSLIDISKSFRTMKIVGQLVKTEQSLTKQRIYDLIKNVENLSLRILFQVHETIKEFMKHRPVFIEHFIKNNFLKNINDWENMTVDQKKGFISLHFGIMSLLMVCNLIDRCVNSIGSVKLLSIIENVTDNNKNPATKLINLASTLWYGKKIDILKIKEMHKQWNDDKNILAIRMLQIVVKNHLYLHKVERIEREKLSNILDDLPVKKQLLIEQKRQRD